MGIPDGHKCSCNIWESLENKASCCHENLLCCHVLSSVCCSCLHVQKELEKGNYNGQGNGGTEEPGTSVWREGWVTKIQLRLKKQTNLKVSDTVNPKIINQIQQTRIPLTSLIGYLNRLKKEFYTTGSEPLRLTASGNCDSFSISRFKEGLDKSMNISSINRNQWD